MALSGTHTVFRKYKPPRGSYEQGTKGWDLKQEKQMMIMQILGILLTLLFDEKVEHNSIHFM